MANLSKASFFDCGKNPPRTRKLVVDGERRIEHIPNGAVERWVNSHGNVSFQQLLQPGALPKTETVDAARGELRRRKPAGADPDNEDAWRWIEWHKCPLRTGTISQGYFPAELRTACPDGAVTRPHVHLACPHVEHVIATRQAKRAEAQKALHAAANAKAAAAEALEQKKLEQQERLNEGILKLVEQNTAANAAGRSKGKGGAGE